VEPEPAGGGVDLAALIVTCGATLLAMRGYRHARPEARALLAGCAGLLLVQWALHSVFGFELFLYSQHWYAPLMVLLSGAMLAGGLESFLGGGVLLALAVLAAGRSASLLRFLAELGGGLSP
jgi:hypothetical protein